MRKLTGIIGCECSGIVREAFRARGHRVYSCDLLPARDSQRFHIQGDILDHLDDGWDFGIFHPPCTHLAVSGARWFPLKQREQREALAFVRRLMAAPFPHALENPVSIISSRIRKPDQTFQLWEFWAGTPGLGEIKRTCLWLHDLPPLMPTTPHETGRHPACWLLPPTPDRWLLRSLTYPGVAHAMADQWGRFLLDRV